MIKIWIIIVILCLNLVCLADNPVKLKFDHMSIKHGISHTVVNSITQDRQGFLWFATNSGLNRFDGYTFNTYHTDQRRTSSLPNDLTRKVFLDRSGTLWISTFGGGLSRYKPSSNGFENFYVSPNQDKNRPLNIRNIVQDRKGSIWLIVDQPGIVRFDPHVQQWTWFYTDSKNPDGPAGQIILSICEDRSGSIWLGTRENGLYVLDGVNKQWTHFRHDPEDSASLRNNTVSALLEDSSGNIWIGTRFGLDRFSRGKQSFVHYSSTTANSDSRRLNNWVSVIFEDSRGVFWIGFYGQGLQRLSSKENLQLTNCININENVYPLGQLTVSEICEDKSGILWLGTNGGVFCLDWRKQLFTHIRREKDNPSRLSSNVVFPILEDDRGQLWIGTDIAGLNCYDPRTDRCTVYRHSDKTSGGISSDSILSLFETEDGMIWIGTNGGGLNRYNPETRKFTVFRHHEGTPLGPSSDRIFCIYEDSDKIIWLGNLRRALNRFDRQKGLFYTAGGSDGRGNSYPENVNIIFPDQVNPELLWLGTLGGDLHCFNRFSGRYETLPKFLESKQNGLTSPIMCLHISPVAPEILWVGRTDGLFRFNTTSKQWRRFDETDGLLNRMIYGILEDGKNCLWMSTNLGISRFNPRSGEFKNYTAADGLQDDEFNSKAYCMGRDGRFFFGGLNGISAFYPDQIQQNTHKPPIVITEFSLFGRNNKVRKSKPETKTLTISYKDNIFSLEFSALDYTNPASNRYAYKLEGFQDDWIYTDASHRVATYTNIPPGRYVFKVKGSNNDEVWNEEGTFLNIIITPPFWKALWFKIVLFCGLVLFGVLLYKKRLGHVKQRLRKEMNINQFLDHCGISKREQEIIDLVLSGKSNKEIEEDLYISSHTVRNHIYNIYKKLGVKNRGGLLILLKSVTSENIDTSDLKNHDINIPDNLS